MTRGRREVRVEEGTDQRDARHELTQQLNRFASMRLVIRVTPVTLPPGRLKLSTRPALTGSPPIPNTIGIEDVALLGRERRRVAANRSEHVDPAAHQIGRQVRQAIVLTVAPSGNSIATF